MKTNILIKKIGEKFGYGIENYNAEQQIALWKFVKLFCSEEFGDIERASLIQILKFIEARIIKSNREELFKLHDELEVMIE